MHNTRINTRTHKTKLKQILVDIQTSSWFKWKQNISNDFHTLIHFQKSYQKSPSFEGVENKRLKRLLAERGFIMYEIIFLSTSSIFKYNFAINNSHATFNVLQYSAQPCHSGTIKALTKGKNRKTRRKYRLVFWWMSCQNVYVPGYDCGALRSLSKILYRTLQE